MSDSPASSFALGYIAAGIGDEELRRSIRGIFSPREVLIDPGYFAQMELVIQRFEVHFANQENYVARLKRENDELRASWNKVGAERQEWVTYAQGLEAERDRLAAVAEALARERDALKEEADRMLKERIRKILRKD